jgi:PqqD family protein of HPr-rel-A system
MGPRRVDDLTCEHVQGELLVYDHRTGETHALNEAAGAVFELCDGTTSRAAMAAELARRCGLPSDEAIVDLALADLEEAGLVVAPEGARQAVTRRALVRRLGLTAIVAAMLPVVETILMTSAEAQAPGTVSAVL